LCAGTKYKKDKYDPFAHITNTCYQSEDPNFNEEECVLTMEDLGEELGGGDEGRVKTEAILRDMRNITGELWKSFKGEFGVYAPLPGCFEHYGLDFIVEDRGADGLGVYLLEVNPGPDFKQSGEKLRGIVGGVIEETVDLVFGGLEFDKDKNGNM